MAHRSSVQFFMIEVLMLMIDVLMLKLWSSGGILATRPDHVWKNSHGLLTFC